MIFINVLGDLVIRRAGGAVGGRAAHRRRLAVVAVLAAARGRPVGRERIIGLLWPEHPGDAARHTLSESLYVLRRDLGEECFLVVGDEVGLNPARAKSDLDEFERALEEGRWEDAVRAYGGPFLGTFSVPDAPEFDRWVQGERDRLARGYGRALEELATAAEGEGALLRAAEWWRRLLAHDAFSSRAALRLVHALRRAGEHAAALRAAEAHVLLLRQELGVAPDARLAALIEELRREPPPPPPAPDPSAAAPPDEAARVDDPAPTPSAGLARAPAPGRSRSRRWRIGAGATAAVGIAAAVLMGLAALAARREPAPRPGFDPRRIAVLYLDDDSPGGGLQYLANGLTEMLIHELSQVEALDVVSRNGVKPYRQGTIPFDSMVAALRVGSVVEGSVARSGDSVRVTVQLIDAATHSHLESRSVVRPLGDVLALQAAVSEEVSGFLRRRVGAQVRLRQAEQETRSEEALDLVLRGEQAHADALELRGSRDTAHIAAALHLLAEADALLARAEAADPRWTRPTVGRAWVAAVTASWTGAGGAQQAAVDSAVARAGRVLAREPASAGALEARAAARWTVALGPGADSGTLLDAVERDLRAAVAAEPELASAWGRLSFLLYARGRLAESEFAARRALEQDAYLEDADQLLRRLYYAALTTENYAAAEDACRRGRRGFPRDWRFVECHLTLLRRDTTRAPDPALAWRLVGELEAMDPPGAAAAAGRAYASTYRRLSAAGVSARAGDAERARAELARARVDAALDPESRISLAYDEAFVLMELGDRAGARARLEVYRAQRPALRGALARDPLVRALLTPAAADSSP